MTHDIKLNSERMKGNGAGSYDGYQVNYLYGLDDLCRKFITKETDVLEFGSHRGISTSLFCAYANHVDAVDRKLHNSLAKKLEEAENLTFHQCSIQKFSTDKLFDFIYIDAQHTRTAVLRDIATALPLLKNCNSVLAGHDMNNETGVTQAVYEAFPQINTGEIVLHRFSDSSWALQPSLD